MIKKINLLFAILLVLLTPSYIFAEDSYTVTCESSYANPLTGETVDGGSNLALGNSMIDNMLTKEVKVEPTKDGYYLTFSLGLASNISNVRFQTMDENQNFKDVPSEHIGTHEDPNKDDKIADYRVKVESLDLYVSPIFYVDPMERDVQFFIKPLSGSASEQEIKKIESKKKDLSSGLSTHIKDDSKDGDESGISTFDYVTIGVGIIVVILLCIGIYYVKKKR